MKMSLRTKGAIGLMALVGYVGLVGVVLSLQRQELLALAVELEHVHRQDGALNKATFAVNRSMLRLQGQLHASDLPASYDEDVALDVELVQASLQALHALLPTLASDVDRLGQTAAALRDTPSRALLVDLIEHERDIELRLERIGTDIGAQRKSLWESYYRTYDQMTLIAVVMNLFGALAFGALVTLFLSRLAWDIRKLEDRAQARSCR